MRECGWCGGEVGGESMLMGRCVECGGSVVDNNGGYEDLGRRLGKRFGECECGVRFEVMWKGEVWCLWCGGFVRKEVVGSEVVSIDGKWVRWDRVGK